MSRPSVIVLLSRCYAEAARDGIPIRAYASVAIFDGYRLELREKGARETGNEHEYLFSSTHADDFVNLLFMGIPLCLDPSMEMGVRFEVKGYEPNQVVSSAAPRARLGYRKVGSPGSGETRPTQLAPSPRPGLGSGREEGVVKHIREQHEPRAGYNDIWRFLLVVGRMKVDDQFPVAVCRAHSGDEIGLWFKRKGIEEFVSLTGLEVLQNKLDLQQLWGFPDAWELGHHWGYDLLPVSLEPLPKSASKQLAANIFPLGGLDAIPVAPAELQARINDAEQKRTHRKQLRMLVNERVPSHLMGADIVKVETTYNQLYIDVSVAGGREPIRIPSARLWEANLTVPGCVEMYGGKLPPVPLEHQHPLAGIILP